MRRRQDTIGRDAIGRGRPWLGLLGVSALVLLSGCGWLGFGGTPGSTQNARPGVDRQIAPTGALPPAASGQHEPGIAATDPVGTPQIGSIVAAKGGQKAQKEAAEKEAEERDAKAREEREKREAAERDAKAKEPQEPAQALPAPGMPGMPAAAVRGDAEPANAEPAATTAPPPAPVSSTPIAPPAAPAPAPAPAPASEQPAAPPRT